MPASERPQTHALDRASSWIGNNQRITTCYVRRGCVSGVINLWVPQNMDNISYTRLTLAFYALKPNTAFLSSKAL